MYEQQFNPFAANLAVIKGYFKSGKVLAIGILYAISAVITLVVGFAFPNVNNSFLNSYASLLEEMGIDAADMTSRANTGSVTVSISFSVIVTILIAVAFILIYVKSRNDSPQSNPKAGITILYVLAMIAFICSIVLAALIGILCILLIVGIVMAGGDLSSISVDLSAEYIADFDIGGLIVGVLIALIIFAVLFVAYMLFVTVNYRRYYASVKASINSVELQTRGAAPYGVICILSAVFIGLGLIGSFASASSYISSGMSAYFVLSLLSSVISMVTAILNASIALGYKSYINKVKFGYTNTPYGGTPAESFIPAPNSDYAQAPHDNNNPYAAPSQPAPYNDGFQNYNAPQPQEPAYQDHYADYNTAQQPQTASYCSNCGAPVDGTAPFCSNCGAKLR